jgi:hypothetical protein
VIIITGYGTIDGAIEAIKEGAWHYATKPLKLNEIRVLAKGALDRISMRQENQRLREALKFSAGLTTIVGNSPAVKELFSMVQRIAQVDCNILLQGASGTILSSLSTAAGSPRNSSAASFSATKRERSPGRRQPKSVCLNQRREGPYSWTKSARCLLLCR